MSLNIGLPDAKQPDFRAAKYQLEKPLFISKIKGPQKFTLGINAFLN